MGFEHMSHNLREQAVKAAEKVRMPERKLGELPASTERYRAFLEHFKPNISSVYYPGCGTDISPTRGFAGKKIIYADNDPHAVRAFRKAGMPIRNVDAKKHRLLKPADVLILRNPGMDPDCALKNLAKDGYVLFNTWAGSKEFIEKMKATSGYEFSGIIKNDPDRPGKARVETALPIGDLKQEDGFNEDYAVFKKIASERELHPEDSLGAKIGAFIKKLFTPAPNHGGHSHGGGHKKSSSHH